MSAAGIEGVKLSLGQLMIDLGDGKSDSRDYYFAERDLGDEALATMAVRIAPLGADLFVDCGHYTTPPMGMIRNPDFEGEGSAGLVFIGTTGLGIVVGGLIGMQIDMGLFGFVAGGAMGMIPGMVLSLPAMLVLKSVTVLGRMPALQGFQEQESTAFRLAVRAALKDAIRQARIPEKLIEELPRDGATRRRVRRPRTA